MTGICILGWSFSSSQFRDSEGFLDGSVSLSISVGIGFLLFGPFVLGPLRHFALWAWLALIGQAAALQLVDAGPQMRYQHYRPWERLIDEPRQLLLILLIVQGLMVAWALTRRWASIVSWLKGSFRLWQLGVVGLVFFLSSATVSHDVRSYISELFFATFIQILNIGNIALAVQAIPEPWLLMLRRRLGNLFRVPNAMQSPWQRFDRLALVAALWVVVVSGLLAIFSYERHPHIPDEVAYLHQANFLAQGSLTAPAPSVPEAFENYLMRVDGDRWYPVPPPGWPLVLAAGAFLGAPWLVNPALAGIGILLTFKLLSQLYDADTARKSIFLLSVSPWYLFMGMNFMSHMATLVCALGATVLVVRARETGSAFWGWLAGGLVGFASLIRPLDGLVIAALLGLWSIGLGGKRLRLSAVTGLVLGSVLIGAFVLPYNSYMTGSPEIFPIMLYTDEYFGPNSNAIGFGPDRGMGWPIDPNPGHSPIDGLINANLNTFSINMELLGWSTGSLLFVAVVFFCGRWTRSDRLMIAVLVAVFSTHFFYYFSGGPDFGARYWFLMIVPCVTLVVRGIQYLQEGKSPSAARQAFSMGRVKAAALLLCLLAVVNFIPWRAIDKYHHYLNMRPDIRYLKEDFGRSLVLIRGAQHPDYVSAATYNPVDLESDAPVFAWDRSAQVTRKTIEAYSDRPVWVIEGPTVSGSGFKVLSGPIYSHKILSEEGKDRLTP